MRFSSGLCFLSVFTRPKPLEFLITQCHKLLSIRKRRLSTPADKRPPFHFVLQVNGITRTYETYCIPFLGSIRLVSLSYYRDSTLIFIRLLFTYCPDLYRLRECVCHHRNECRPIDTLVTIMGWTHPRYVHLLTVIETASPQHSLFVDAPSHPQEKQFDEATQATHCTTNLLYKTAIYWCEF